jgi:hypothetical protein
MILRKQRQRRTARKLCGASMVKVGFIIWVLSSRVPNLKHSEFLNSPIAAAPRLL